MYNIFSHLQIGENPKLCLILSQKVSKYADPREVIGLYLIRLGRGTDKIRHKFVNNYFCARNRAQCNSVRLESGVLCPIQYLIFART